MLTDNPRYRIHIELNHDQAIKVDAIQIKDKNITMNEIFMQGVELIFKKLNIE